MKFIIAFLAFIQISFAANLEVFVPIVPYNKSEATKISRKLTKLNEANLIKYVNQIGFNQLTEKVQNFYSYTGFQEDTYENMSGIFNFIMSYFKESNLVKDNENAFNQFCNVCHLGAEYIKREINERNRPSTLGIAYESPTKTTKIDYASSQMPEGYVFEDFSIKPKPVASYNKTYNGRK